MKVIYEVWTAPDWRQVDYHDKEKAFDAVEKAGAGRVVTFIKGFGSSAMAVFENGEWRMPYIHG
jgi:hypothetical protein